MSSPRNRGKKRPKLRDYSHLTLSAEEKDALRAVAESGDEQPMVIAILGCILVEHELDILLRAKFRKRDERTWQVLIDERGPLRSFSTKITTAWALGICDDKLKHDLDVVRAIRNAFAHSRKLLDFTDPLIVAELASSRLIRAKFRKYLRDPMPTEIMGRAAFIMVCLKLQTALIRRQARPAKAKVARLKKRFAAFSGFNPQRLNAPNFTESSPSPIPQDLWTGLFGDPIEHSPRSPNKKK